MCAARNVRAQFVEQEVEVSISRRSMSGCRGARARMHAHTHNNPRSHQQSIDRECVRVRGSLKHLLYAYLSMRIRSQRNVHARTHAFRSPPRGRKGIDSDQTQTVDVPARVRLTGDEIGDTTQQVVGASRAAPAFSIDEDKVFCVDHQIGRRTPGFEF